MASVQLWQVLSGFGDLAFCFITSINAIYRDYYAIDIITIVLTYGLLSQLNMETLT